MSKIRKAPPHTAVQHHKPKVHKEKPKEQDAIIEHYAQRNNLSLSEARALRDGINYGDWRRDGIEVSYKEKHGKGYGKGGKKAVVESLEAELREILEKRISEAEAKAEAEAKEQVRIDEIKQEQIQDTQKKEDLRDFDEKAYKRKIELKKESIEADTIKQTAPKEVKKSFIETVAKTHQIDIHKNEYTTPSISSILLQKEIESEIADKIKNK